MSFDADLDDVDFTGDFTDYDTGERRPGGGRFKKNSDTSKRSSSSTASTSMQLQLNKLSDREVDDSNMKSVFGPTPNKPVTDAMRVNPLYEKGVNPAYRDDGGLILGSSQNYDGPSDTNSVSQRNHENAKGDEPTILYNDNFKLKTKDSSPNKPKVAKFGRIIPARVKRNTHRPPRPVTVSNKTLDTTEDEPISKERMDLIEESLARRRIRRGVRYVSLLILAFLVFILLIAIIIYFATSGQ